MDTVSDSKGGLDSIQQHLCKIETSLEKTLASLNYIREPTPQSANDEQSKAESEGTIPSITHTAGRLQKLVDSIATTTSVIRYG